MGNPIKHAYVKKPQENLWTPKLGWVSLVGSVPCVFSHIGAARVVPPEDNGSLGFGAPRHCPLSAFLWLVLILSL